MWTREDGRYHYTSGVHDIEFNGTLHCLPEWSAYAGIDSADVSAPYCTGISLLRVQYSNISTIARALPIVLELGEQLRCKLVDEYLLL